jgi:hypothetical protein
VTHRRRVPGWIGYSRMRARLTVDAATRARRCPVRTGVWLFDCLLRTVEHPAGCGGSGGRSWTGGRLQQPAGRQRGQVTRPAIALRYIREPAPGLPYFQRATALDPRTAIVHEGVHAQQLALSWRHPDPARRRYYDSAPNEGIAFYNEELMLQAGLFNDAPASAEFIVSSQGLRALRVEIDIGLALGDLTLEQAAGRLATAVPMDRQSAWEEAVFFASNPGQGLAYQAGKLQVLDLLAVACRRGGAFDLREFHDRLWREGNVPLALQRWELLGRRDHLEEAERLAAAHAAAEVPPP